MRRVLMLAVLPVVAALVVGFVVVRFGPGLVRDESGDAAVPIGGPFTLEDGAGRTVTQQDFKGRWMLVYFGYTHCPDACPTTLNAIGLALGKMSAAARAKVAPVFITVDPARDTPALMQSYAKAFDPQIVGLSGTPAQIDAVEQEYHVYAQKHEIKGAPAGDYEMDHSSIVYVMKPDGSFALVLEDTMAPEEMAKKLTQLEG